MSADEMLRDVLVTNVAFADDSLEIQFLDRNDQQETAAIVKTLIIDCRANKLLNQLNEINELLEEIVEAGYIAVRNPPQTLNPRDRFRKKASNRSFERLGEDEDEDGDEE